MSNVVEEFDGKQSTLEQYPASAGLSGPGEQLTSLAESARRSALELNSRWNLTLFTKRVLDIVLASVALVILSPTLLIVAILIRLESPGPALFVQERWGKDMRRIRVYKFRSMHMDRCDPSGVSQTVPNDPRITGIGRFIRKSNIDELPQLVNVLKGDLSLVGPRCHAVRMLAAGVPYEELIPEYHYRHMVRPGITGLAQIRGYRGPTHERDPAVKRIAFDLEYIRDISIMGDVRILAVTVLREVFGGTGF